LALGRERIRGDFGYTDSLDISLIVDATNSTRSRRKMILERVHQIEDLNVLFIESICTDKKVAHERCPHAYRLLDFGEQHATKAFGPGLQRHGLLSQ
jgi:hypothetical protein